MINDFKELTIYGKGKPSKKKLLNQNKGQKEMVEAFISASNRKVKSQFH